MLCYLLKNNYFSYIFPFLLNHNIHAAISFNKTLEPRSYFPLALSLFICSFFTAEFFSIFAAWNLCLHFSLKPIPSGLLTPYF